VRDPDRYPF